MGHGRAICRLPGSRFVAVLVMAGLALSAVLGSALWWTGQEQAAGGRKKDSAGRQGKWVSVALPPAKRTRRRRTQPPPAKVRRLPPPPGVTQIERLPTPPISEVRDWPRQPQVRELAQSPPQAPADSWRQVYQLRPQEPVALPKTADMPGAEQAAADRGPSPAQPPVTQAAPLAADPGTADAAQPIEHVAVVEHEPPESAVADDDGTEPPSDAPLDTAGSAGSAEEPLTLAEQTAARRAVAIMEDRARQLVMAAFDSAQRGATHVARRKFEGALRLIAQAADMGAGRSTFSRRLTNGFLALAEVDDFVPHDQRPHVQLDVESVVRRHRSQVVSESEAAGLSQIAVQQRYYAYAQQELAAAIGRSGAGSLALYGLGKFHLERAGVTADGAQREVPRAVAFFQAALQVDPANHRACNELGVLMARCGRLDVAKLLLLRSVRTAPNADAWHNLAQVHHRLGESHLANLAEQEQLKLHDSGDRDPLDSRSVHWLELAEFARTQPGPHETAPPAAVRPESSPPAAAPQSARRLLPFLWTR